MNKKLLVVLAGIATLALSSCGGNKEDAKSSSSSKNSSSSSSSIITPSIYTEEEIAQGKAYLDIEGDGNVRSICKVGEGEGWTQYCTEGPKTYAINHVNYNTANNVGDITIIQHNTTDTNIKPPAAVKDADTFPAEENKSFFQDFKLNACGLASWRNTDLCKDQNLFIDEGNHWNYRIMVDTEGKIAAMYPGGVGYANPVDPYFSDFDYTKENNDNMYTIYTRDFSGVTLAADKNDAELTAMNGMNEKHSQAWRIADSATNKETSTGFNILEHPDHKDGRHDNYKFVGGSEMDVMTWAFLGSIKDGDGDSIDYSTALTHFDKVLDSAAPGGTKDNPEEVWALKKVTWAIEFAKFYIPGQFDDVRFSYTRPIKDNFPQYTDLVLTESFEYDPLTVYKKFKAYADYLVEKYDANPGQTSNEADEIYYSLPEYEEAIETAIYGLNCDRIRNSTEAKDQIDATAMVETQLETYKYALKRLATQLN